eukprot:CAMPEP_0181125024 /NCGR_PEP_ID=MMETSP1071-20121207/26817_1 /TAXON_ID=35127 /ORGANISM="Thalassiosira sp., Strain NH16" /LENGTH=143 /DNA_ID=CAMNT_0023210415 /DNA_START=64 /DNA_END=495 /DNA_ORIENTATION=+
MSEHPEAKKSAEPKLCKMGCGFFPKDDTSNNKGGSSVESENTKATDAGAGQTSKPHTDPKEESEPSASRVERLSKKTPLTKEDVPVTEADPPSPAKKKKKKSTYKNMMAGMLAGNSPSRHVEKEKEKLKEATGGGQFQKVDII